MSAPQVSGAAVREISAVVFLGSSEFPGHPPFESPAFRRSKNDFEDYLRAPAPHGLGLRSAAVLDLFGSQYTAAEQVREIVRFLDRVKADHPDAIRNLIIYYVGHGYFGDSGRNYFLALSSFDPDQREMTGFAVSTFKTPNVRSRTKFFRLFYILDCCFAGEALRQIQGDTAAVAQIAAQDLGELETTEQVPTPTRGSALLCATSADNVALAPSDIDRTLFSDALLDVLTRGDAAANALLTFYDISTLVWARILEKHEKTPDRQVRPEVHAPDQSQGDVSKRVPLFPNPGAPRRVLPANLIGAPERFTPQSPSWNFSSLVSELKRQLFVDGVFHLDWGSITHPSLDDELASERYLFRLFIQKLVFAASRLSPHAIGSANAWVCHRIMVNQKIRQPQFLRSAEREGHFSVDQIVTTNAGRARYRTNSVSYLQDDFEFLSAAAQAIVSNKIQFIPVYRAGYKSDVERKGGITHILGIPLYCLDDLTYEDLEGVPMALTVDLEFREQSPEEHLPDILSNGRELHELFKRFKGIWKGSKSLEGASSSTVPIS